MKAIRAVDGFDAANEYANKNLEPLFIGKMYGFSSIILSSARVRVSGGHLCKAEAPTEATAETRKTAEILDVLQGFSTYFLTVILRYFWDKNHYDL